MIKSEKLIAIVGPTASGKTALAVQIAERFGGELISADSRQIYTEMDIGTGKEATPVPQHLIDITKPSVPLTVAEWQERAFAVIADILERQKLPIVVGGTGLYVRSVVEALNIPAVAPDPAMRAKMEQWNNSELFWKLEEIDPDAAHRVDRHNKRRLIRALEVARAIEDGRVGEPRVYPHYQTLQIGINLPREELYRRIDARVDEQFRRGLVEEVRRLLATYDPASPAMSGIGYREVVHHLQGQLTLEEAVERVKFDTHAYARRQATWFNKDKRIRWVADTEEAIGLVEAFLKG